MSEITDIIPRPLLPVELIWALAALVLLLGLIGLRQRLKGAWLRLGAAAALLATLLDPAAVSEDKTPLPDIAVIVVDESASQTIENRADVTKAAVEDLKRQIALASDDGAHPIDVRVVTTKGDPKDGTKLLTALAKATEDIPNEQFAGAVLVTDGAAADAALGAPAVSRDAEGAPTAPVHVLVTGRKDEYDRRIEVEAAASFGIVDEEAAIKFRVVDDGAAPATARFARVRIIVDGRDNGAIDARVGDSITRNIKITHGGATVVELRVAPLQGELTQRNNTAVLSINGVRDRLKVLLISGEPHPGERTWRNLLKSDPSVELVHFTILKPPHKDDRARPNELALIEFPTHQLFEEKLNSFDLIVFDRFRDRPRILRSYYISNIANYVREAGKAVLISSGPSFAGRESISQTPIGSVLPALPTGRIVEGAFRPDLTGLGDRHPVTRGLEGRGDADKGPSWGRWFRRLEINQLSGDSLMEARGGAGPLLILDRVGNGRVALVASDHTWLWARGYDGGGPQAELLKRLVHWLMKEPELEEEALVASPKPGGFEVTRRSLIDGDKTVLWRAPDGTEKEVKLDQVEPGVWRGTIETEALGVHNLIDGPQSVTTAQGRRPLPPREAVAAVGPPDPQEFAEPISTTARLAPVAEATKGAVRRLADGAPELRRSREGRAMSGDGWIGLARREAFDVENVRVDGIGEPWMFFGLAAFLVIAAWRVEGR